MGRLFRLRTLFVIVLAAAIASAVATVLNQKQRLEVMDVAERRQYLGDKLSGRMTDEQIDKIAAAISEKLDASKELTESIADAAEEAAEVVEEVAEEAKEAADEGDSNA